MTTAKTIASTRWTFVVKVMSLLFTKLSSLVKVFLSRSKCLLVSWMQSPPAVIFGASKNKVCPPFHCFPIYLPWSDGSRCHELSFLTVEFQANFFTLLFHFHQVTLWFFFAFCHKGGAICVSEVIDISPGNLDSSLCFIQPGIWHMYSAYRLNKQGDNLQPWCTPFLISDQSVVPCPVLTVFLDPDLLVQIFSLLLFNVCSVW